MPSIADFKRQAEEFKRTLRKANATVTGESIWGSNQVSSKHCELDYPVLDEAAFYGLAGDFVRAVEPSSEADPAAVLLHTIVGFGCLVGSKASVMVERTPHPPRINCLVVGRSALARKGTSWSSPKYLLGKVDPHWTLNRIKSGLSSGEGLIDQVRDSLEADTGDVGAEDKRLLVVETEFSSTLKMMERAGNTLSAVLRDAWDHGNLSTLTKNSRIAASGAHVCVIGHITIDELLRLLNATEQSNGLANRFLFVLVKRSKLLPSGQGIPECIFDSFAARFTRVVEVAQTRGTITRDAEAEELWKSIYPYLEDDRPGLTASILARGAAQVLRLSLAYALMDEEEARKSSTAIRSSHLLAALAIWDYAKASTLRIFGDSIGDPTADRLLSVIKSGPQTDTDLYQVLGKRDGGRKAPALERLVRLEMVHSVKQVTAGRPVTWWHAGHANACEICVERVQSPLADTFSPHNTDITQRAQ